MIQPLSTLNTIHIMWSIVQIELKGKENGCILSYFCLFLHVLHEKLVFLLLKTEANDCKDKYTQTGS